MKEVSRTEILKEKGNWYKMILLSTMKENLEMETFMDMEHIIGLKLHFTKVKWLKERKKDWVL